MAIKHYWLAGDMHGSTFPVLYNMNEIIKDSEDKDPSHYAIILLGDVGFNYNKPNSWQAKKLKKKANNYGFRLYCLRGNHEDRADNNFNIHWNWDEDVRGVIGIEPEFPNIHYLNDKVDIYHFGKYKCLTIPGAYSVDKYIRLQNDWEWFPEEQLTEMEMASGMRIIEDNSFDFILSHTCPASYIPVDLLLNNIDQSTVDNTMEIWMDKVKDACKWDVWCWGHYHQDRLERPHCEMFYQKPVDMNVVWERWQKDEPEWWIPKSPQYYWN